MIYCNAILQQVATGERIRIIWIDEVNGVAIAISMKSDSAMPYFVEMEELRIMLEEGMMEQVDDAKRKIDK